MSYVYAKKRKVNGKISVPGSKSETIRGIMFGMLSDGETVVHNPLYSKDGIAALNAARAFGAVIDEIPEENKLIVHGMNGKLNIPEEGIDTMNSGTTTSFVLGISTLLEDGNVFISGDEQICRRVWKDEISGLTQLGASIVEKHPGKGCPPLAVRGPIHGGDIKIDGTISQHVSGILVPAALLEEGNVTTVECASPKEFTYVDLTIDWLQRFGIRVEKNEEHDRYVIPGGQKFHHCDCLVAADWSSTCFPLVAAVVSGGEVEIDGVDFENAQGDKKVVDVLIEMGANIRKDPENNRIIVKGDRKLHGIDIDMNLIPDAYPILVVAAAAAEGTTHFTNIKHVRAKETDRIACMEKNMKICGIETYSTENDSYVTGGIPRTAEIESFDDHRIAMAMTVLALFAGDDGEMRINNAECANVSFPGYYELMNESIGAGFELRED